LSVAECMSVDDCGALSLSSPVAIRCLHK